MKLAMIGFGQAGGKIVDKFLEYDAETGSGIVRSAVAINTAKADLMGLERVPEDNRVLIGQARVKGHGVGADNELGAEIAEEDIDEIQGAIDNIPVHEVDAFLIVAGLGGGTGSGGAPVLAKHLKRIYTEPVYGLGILPGSDEGGIYTLNAARSFQTFTREVDNLLVFDNDAWRQAGESVESGYEEINDEIVRRFGVILGAGEINAGDEVGESVVDSSEIINTLDSGGVSTVGYATETVELSDDSGLLSKFTGGGDSTEDGIDAANTTNRITSLVRKAALGRLTLPCEIEGAERALLVMAGPPEHLNRKGIERGRKWIEEQTGSMEVRGGDYPINEPQVASAILLAGVTDVPRIKELQQVAIEAQDNIEDIRSESEENLQELVEDDDDELEPLF
ncbi:MAG TPA: tubulin/FtsZ family protein [Natrialbaceae archaeon]|nr:tubulin/FtsZ family protein [Natrialbaceae archaeon]